MGKLIFIDEKHAGRVYKLALEKTTVGRSEQNLLVIQDGSVSAHHCEILVNGDEVIVRDLGSRNGTVVNGTRLRNQQTQLKHGQKVRFGSVEARLDLEGSLPDTGEDSATGITAIHAMGRIMTQQRRERAQPKPGDVSVILEVDSNLDPGEQTVVAPPTPTKPTRPADTVFETPEEQASGRGSKKPWIIVAVVLVLAIGGVFLWWFLNRGK